MKKWLVSGLIAWPLLLFSQDYTWWANNVGWDGSTHWRNYIIPSPAYLGPNALPIPALTTGTTPEKSFFEVEAQGHTRKGDQTLNPTLRACYAVTPGKIALALEWTPVEYFEVSHLRKTERRVFFEDYADNTATGDVYMHTYLQLMDDSRRWADMMLRVGYRFASSNQVGAARFTDTPGYYFDLSAGKQVHPSWRVFGMLGFYVWQTYLDYHVQNDAFLFGLGAAWSNPNWQVEGGLRSYLGYQENGDDPMALRVQVYRNTRPRVWYIGVQQGLMDLKYSSVFVGLQYKIGQ